MGLSGDKLRCALRICDLITSLFILLVIDSTCSALAKLPLIKKLKFKKPKK